MMFIMIPRAAVSAQRIGRVLQVEPSVNDPENPVNPGEPEGLVEFEKVSFAYPDAQEKTIDGVSFTAEPGKTTAVIGGTGAGKSTLIGLIPRFYDVTEGRILIDGRDIREISQRRLREMIGYIPQKGMLFSGTIGSNLRYGKEDATDEELREAAETAQAMEFIEEKDRGFEGEVSQGGTYVSGGQKQRLSIARALVKRPKIYIFDDSFSALDFKTDKALRGGPWEKGRRQHHYNSGSENKHHTGCRSDTCYGGRKTGGKGHPHAAYEDCSVYREIALSQLSEEELERGRS